MNCNSQGDSSGSRGGSSSGSSSGNASDRILSSSSASAKVSISVRVRGTLGSVSSPLLVVHSLRSRACRDSALKDRHTVDLMSQGL